MNHFPEFMKHPADRISAASQHSSGGIEGYVYDGLGGGQMAFWECRNPGSSPEHVHEYDEYFVVVEGQYTLIIRGERIRLAAGQEYLIASGVPHAGEHVAGTRTIHAFGGVRAKRQG